MFSTIASMTKSAFSAPLSILVVVVILLKVSCTCFSKFCGSFSNFFLFDLVKLTLIEPNALFNKASVWSTNVSYNHSQQLLEQYLNP